MLSLVIKQHSHRLLANVRRISIARLIRYGSTFSEVAASENPGAVHTDACACLDLIALLHQPRDQNGKQNKEQKHEKHNDNEWR